MKPIYKFVLDEETGEITVQEITEYRIKVHEFTHRKTYIHKAIYGANYTREESFDQLKHSHVYSFNPDIAHARKIILESVNARASKAFKEYKRWSEVKTKMENDKWT